MKTNDRSNGVRQQIKSFARSYLDYLGNLLKELDLSAIESFVDVLLAARNRGSRIFFIGNGGSAATASHFANDVSLGSRSWTKPFRAVSLADNMAILSSIANDYDYEDVFVKQLETQMVAGDVVVAISVSGNSPNVVKALSYANDNDATTVALTGFDGGELKRIAQVAVHVPTEKGDYGHAEDVHMILDHLVGAYLGNMCRLEGGKTCEKGASHE